MTTVMPFFIADAVSRAAGRPGAGRAAGQGRARGGAAARRDGVRPGRAASPAAAQRA